MAARKRMIDEATAQAIATRAATVVVEQMQGQFRAFGESLDGLREKVERGFEQVDRRFDRVEAVVHEHERQLRDVNAQLGELRVAVDKKVDRDEVEGIVERAVGRAVGH